MEIIRNEESKVKTLTIDKGQAKLLEIIKVKSQKGYQVMTMEVYKKEQFFTIRGGDNRKKSTKRMAISSRLNDGVNSPYGTHRGDLTPGDLKSENEILNFCGVEDKFSKVAPMEIGASLKRPLNLVFDSEWQSVSNERNYILSYQFACTIADDMYLFFFHYPPMREVDIQYRLAFSTVLSHVLCWLNDNKLINIEFLEKGFVDNYRALDKKEKVKVDIPRFFLNIITHAGKGDISTFFTGGRSLDPRLLVRDIDGAVVTLSPYYDFFWTPSRNNSMALGLSFKDTMALTPAKFKSLASLGELVGVDKVELADGVIENMADLMADDPVLFREYALSDCVVGLLAINQMYGENRPVPATLASYGANMFAGRMTKLFFGDSNELYNSQFRGLVKMEHGLTVNDESKDNKKIQFLTDTSLEPINANAELLLRYSSLAYSGGCNQCFSHGFIDVKTYDYDLKGAYPTGISAVYDPDYFSSVEIFQDVYLKPGMGLDPQIPAFFNVDFKFPSNTFMPCIPVSCMGNMIFPLEGKNVYCSAPEIVLALKLGASVFCNFGVKAVAYTDKDGNMISRSGIVYKDFLEAREEAARIHGKKSLEETTLKTINNSIYGKMVQGVISNRRYNPRLNSSEDLSMSKLTNPVIGSMGTSMVRSILIAIINELQAKGYVVHSVTTDGFITNAPSEVVYSLEAFGFAPIFQETREYLSGSDEIWEIKHEQEAFLNVTTRGNVALSPKGVFAKAGYKTEIDPNKDPMGAREEFFMKVAKREAPVKVKYKQWPSHRALVNENIDFKPFIQEKSIRLDYDFKRKPLESSIEDLEFEINGETINHVKFSTIPFKDLEEFVKFRSARDSFPAVTNSLTVKTLFVKANRTQTGALIGNDLKKAILTTILRGYRGNNPNYKIDSFNDLTGTQIIQIFNGLNLTTYKFTSNDWKNAGRTERQKNLLDYPIVEEVLEDIRALSDRDIEAMLSYEDD